MDWKYEIRNHRKYVTVKNCMTLHWSVPITKCILTAHLNHLLIYIHTFSLLHLIGTLCNILLKCTLDIQPGVQFRYTLFHMVASCFDTSSQKIKSKQINTSCNQSHQGKRQEHNAKIIKDLSHIYRQGTSLHAKPKVYGFLISKPYVNNKA